MVRQSLPAELLTPGVLAILRGLPLEVARAVASECVEAGIEAVEVTLDSPGALTTIETLVAADIPLVGAGTVLTLDDAKAAYDAGARVLVSPHTDPRLVEWAADEGLAYLPGALTPTEIVAAWSAGAAAVKLFPAGSAGPAYLRELSGPFADVPFVPTGGVNAQTAADWIAAGAAAVAVGGWLTRERSEVSSRARQLVAAVQSARKVAP